MKKTDSCHHDDRRQPPPTRIEERDGLIHAASESPYLKFDAEDAGLSPCTHTVALSDCENILVREIKPSLSPPTPTVTLPIHFKTLRGLWDLSMPRILSESMASAGKNQQVLHGTF